VRPKIAHMEDYTPSSCRLNQQYNRSRTVAGVKCGYVHWIIAAPYYLPFLLVEA